MAIQKGNVLTGARAKLLIAGVKVGYAKNFTVRESLEHQPVDALDNIETEENVPTRYKVNITFGFVRVVGNSVRKLNFMASVGSSPDEHLKNILAAGVVQVQLQDNQTGASIALVDSVSLTENNLQVDAAGIAGVDVTGVGIRMRDEFDS